MSMRTPSIARSLLSDGDCLRIRDDRRRQFPTLGVACEQIDFISRVTKFFALSIANSLTSDVVLSANTVPSQSNKASSTRRGSLARPALRCDVAARLFSSVLGDYVPKYILSATLTDHGVKPHHEPVPSICGIRLIMKSSFAASQNGRHSADCARRSMLRRCGMYRRSVLNRDCRR